MAKNEVEVHIKPVLDGPVVRPGDKLIARVNPDRNWTLAQVDKLAADIKERLPGVDVCVVTADQLVIYRPEPEVDCG